MGIGCGVPVMGKDFSDATLRARPNLQEKARLSWQVDAVPAFAGVRSSSDAYSVCCFNAQTLRCLLLDCQNVVNPWIKKAVF